MSNVIESRLPALRRYGALLLGSKRLADEHIEGVLIRGVAVDHANGLVDLYKSFHRLPLPESTLELEDFGENDHRLLLTLHKLGRDDRALLLLTTVAALGREPVALVLGDTSVNVGTKLARARLLMEASDRNRLCVIVEDDPITMRHLQAELTHERLGVGGMAKNRREGLGLANRVKPDIAVIDLALPEGVTAGADVAQCMRDRFSTKIIFVTAFAKIAEDLARSSDMIVPKPWSSGSLRQAIATATA